MRDPFPSPSPALAKAIQEGRAIQAKFDRALIPLKDYANALTDSQKMRALPPGRYEHLDPEHGTDVVAVEPPREPLPSSTDPAELDAAYEAAFGVRRPA
jgi:hypothetical protein